MIISNKLRNKCLPFFSLFNPLMLLLIRVIRKKTGKKFINSILSLLLTNRCLFLKWKTALICFFFYFTLFTIEIILTFSRLLLPEYPFFFLDQGQKVFFFVFSFFLSGLFCSKQIFKKFSWVDYSNIFLIPVLWF